MVDFYNKNKFLINNILFVLALVIFAYAFINYLFYYVAPFVVGYVISLILNPFADFLNKKYKIHRGICALFLIAIALLILIFLGTVIVSKISTEIEAFSLNAPYFAEEAKSFINSARESIDNMLAFVPDDFREFVDEGLAQLGSAITGGFGSTVKTGSINVVSSIPYLLLNCVLSFISAFFFIKDKYVIKKLFEQKQIMMITDRLSIVKTGLITALSGYIKAQLIIMSIISAICILGLTIMGNPYAIIIGLFTGIIDALPVFGLGAVFWPWILYSFLTHNNSQAIALCIIYGTGFLTRQLLEPKVLGQQIGIHPLITLMSIYIGLKVFGFAGLLLGPVTVISMKIILRQTSEEK